MYHISPLGSAQEKIELPKCMYSMKSANGIQPSACLNGEIISNSKEVKMDPALQAIADRQLEVIAKLRNLRDTVNGLVSKHGGSTKGPCKVTSCAKSSVASSAACTYATPSALLENAHLPDEIVIEANPNRPPLSLLFFKKFLQNVKVVNHVHSSCKTTVDPKLISLFNQDAGNVKSTIRIVWKTIAGSRLTPSTLGSCGVDGESNIARYISRVLTTSDSSLNYDALSIEDLVLVDGVLEASELVDASPDHFLNFLQGYVQKRSSSGSSRTIADCVGYSTLRYLTKQRSQQSLQKSLVDWMNCLTNEVPSLC